MHSIIIKSKLRKCTSIHILNKSNIVIDVHTYFLNNVEKISIILLLSCEQWHHQRSVLTEQAAKNQPRGGGLGLHLGWRQSGARLARCCPHLCAAGQVRPAGGEEGVDELRALAVRAEADGAVARGERAAEVQRDGARVAARSLISVTATHSP